MNTEPKASKIKFTDYYLPALPNGGYTLTVTQALSDDDKKITAEPIPNPLITKFYVAGTRFYLGPKDITSVFPPATSLGNHSNAFPHIMISRSTMPWERFTASNDTKTPWLALLVIYEEEEAELSSRVAKLNEVMTALNITPPLEPGQSENDTVQVLQIQKTLLQKILPSTGNLAYLAHIRELEDDEGKAAGPETAVVVANRLAKKGGRSTVYLVSLENRYKNNQFDYSAVTGDSVSLLQLYSWSFTCTDQGDFTDILKKLNRQTSTLRKPDIGVAVIDKYLGKGFYPLPHKMRQGAQTVSWYHGPLGTGNVAFKTNELKPDSDSYLCYDADNGLIDVSYPAAWEMGRLLALQNVNFSTELYRWKQQYVQSLHLQAQAKQIPNLLHSNRNYTPPAVPDSVSKWLYNLSLLQGVPFNYLVPDEELLPAESIRFFKLDQAWIYALRNGSISVGRVGSSQDQSPENQLLLELKKQPDMITGFILRSEAVSGWPGMLAQGFNVRVAENDPDPVAPAAQLEVLRNENLSPNVKLCLFAGNLQTLSLHLKAEALHFGLDIDGAGYSKKWRNENGSEGEAISVDVTNGMLDLDKLLVAYQNKVTTSAQLALQLLEGVEELRLTAPPMPIPFLPA